MSLLSEDQIARLLAGEVISAPSGVSLRESALEALLTTIIDTASAELKTLHRCEWNHYGSGYASFVDAWFYYPDGRARISPSDEHHAGVFVLFSRLSHFYVLGQGEKAWRRGSASSYMPDLNMVDSVSHPALLSLATALERILSRYGLARVGKTLLSTPLPAGFEVPTILSSPPFSQFDALFYWED